MPEGFNPQDCLTVEYTNGHVIGDVRAGSIKDWSLVRRYVITGRFLSWED